MKANNLQLGRIYINAQTGAPCRLVNIVSCTGVWLEAYDGQGYGDTIPFEDCHFASNDEVQDFLEDLATYSGQTPEGVASTQGLPLSGNYSFNDDDVIKVPGFVSADDEYYDKQSFESVTWNGVDYPIKDRD
tara:strand:+ start:804 stop:1199 length:396 start_codon:yes stop_codon:yes gene_type:complete